MVEANKALIHRWIDAWIANDIAILDELFAPNYSVNGVQIGLEGVKKGVQFLHSVLADISAEANEMVAEKDKVVIRWTVRGRHTGSFMGIPPTGQDLELTGINIYHIRDHKIVANHERTNIAEVIQTLKSSSG
jgi:steroid delta-isomerase-like uncharacterized protein